MSVKPSQPTSKSCNPTSPKSLRSKSPRRFWHLPSASASSVWTQRIPPLALNQTPTPPPKIKITGGFQAHIKSPSAGTIDVRTRPPQLHFPPPIPTTAGATIVKTPSEAIRGMRRTGPGVNGLIGTDLPLPVDAKDIRYHGSPKPQGPLWRKDSPPRLPQIYSQPISIAYPVSTTSEVSGYGYSSTSPLSPHLQSPQFTPPLPRAGNSASSRPSPPIWCSDNDIDRDRTPPLRVRPRPSAPSLRAAVRTAAAASRDEGSETEKEKEKEKEKENEDKRATIRPPPRVPLPPIPFEATLLRITSSRLPSPPGVATHETGDQSLIAIGPGQAGRASSATAGVKYGLVIIKLDFAYSTDNPPRNESVRFPLDVLKRAGGNHLLDYVQKVVERHRHRHSDASSTAANRDLAVKIPGHTSEMVNCKTERQRGSGESSGSGSKVEPDMTDGESGTESDLESEYGLEALLRDEYLKSLYIPQLNSSRHKAPHDFSYLPPPPLLHALGSSQDHDVQGVKVGNDNEDETISLFSTGTRKRAQTRNQYIQRDRFPSPASALTKFSGEPIQARRSKTADKVPLGLKSAGSVRDEEDEAEQGLSNASIFRQPGATTLSDTDRTREITTGRGGIGRAESTSTSHGSLIELEILLLRDATPYHLLIQRLISGTFANIGNMSEKTRKKVEEEARWLGMRRIVDELSALGAERRDWRMRGGEGYI